MVHYGKRLISRTQKFLTSTDKTYFGRKTEHETIIAFSFEIILNFSNFLRS